MKKRFRRGLVVGKFAPLHLGHELVLRRAQDECEELVIVSYSKPEFAGCEPGRRERWLAELFPAARRLVLTDAMTAIPRNDADETTHRRFVGWLCQQHLGVTVDAVFTSENYGDGFAAELSQYFREHRVNGSPEVKHVLVDRGRGTVPISGTEIRADVHVHRRWLSPAVYASFVERVCLLGGESTGKSTLAVTLAQDLGTSCVAEYGRELWEAKNGALLFEDMCSIAEEQIAREEAAARSTATKRFVFCDTSPLTTLFYSHELFGRADAGLKEFAERTYAHVFLCAPDFPFAQDGTRRDVAFQQRQHAWYEAELARRNVRFTVLRGSVDERVQRVKTILFG